MKCLIVQLLVLVAASIEGCPLGTFQLEQMDECVSMAPVLRTSNSGDRSANGLRGRQKNLLFGLARNGCSAGIPQQHAIHRRFPKRTEKSEAVVKVLEQSSATRWLL